MKRIIYIFMLLLPFVLSGAASSDAMPPHPELLKKWRSEGTLQANLKKAASARSVSMRTSPVLKSVPAAGTVRIPVILVAYSEAYSAGKPLAFTGNAPAERGRLFMIMASVLIILLLMSRPLLWNNRLPKPVMPLYAAAFSLLLSCNQPVTLVSTEREFPTDSSVYDDLLNNADLSMRQYFSDMSGSKLTLQFDIYGPVTVSKAWSYYGDNDLSGNDMHPGELAAESVRLMISNNASTDFSIYDNNSVGEVDTVIIIHEGPGEEYLSPEETIWSHQWDLASAQYYGDGPGPVSTDGVSFNSYIEVPEYTESRGDSSVGVYAHEFGHVLGLPDLYDTSGETNGAGVWSLMGSGSWGSDGSGNDPAPLLAWERVKAGGTGTDRWVTITEISAAQNDQSIDDIESSYTAYKVMLDNTAGEEQYLLLEGKTGISDSGWYVPGSVKGIIVTHIHEGVISEYELSNTINAGNSRIHGVNIVEADGRNDLWDISETTDDTGNVSDLFTTGESIINALMYDDNTGYSLSTAPTTDDITAINTGTTPMTFDYTP